MSNISDWLNDRVYPAIFEKADEVFPEHAFNQYRNGWRSQTYLNGAPHKTRQDKTVITSRAPYCILEQGGNRPSIYDYIKDRDGSDNKQTLETLSRLSGIPLPKWDHTHTVSYQVKKIRDQILEDTQGYFAFCLETSAGGKKVMDYLQTERGYSETDIKAMDLGCILTQNKLVKYLTETKKHKAEDVTRVIKLNKAIGGSHVLTVPFREPGGQIRGFIFRTIKEGIQPKYYYSTSLKREDTLFNLKAVKRDKDLIIMEGLLDALISEAKGLNNVIALGGTSLNRSQLNEAIKRGAKKITFCLDNDKPGEEATLKAMALINNLTDLPVFVATLPEGVKDPDQLIKEKGIKPLQDAIEKAPKSYTYKFNLIIADHLKRYDEKGEPTAKDLEDFLDETYILINQIKKPIDREFFINHILKTVEGYKISKESLQATVDRLRYKEDREIQKKRCDELIKKTTRHYQKGEINEALALMAEQSKELLQKDKEVEYSRLEIPTRRDDLIEGLTNKPEAMEAGYKIFMPEKKYESEDLLLPAGALSIFAAPTSHGKSTILINTLLNMASQYQDKKFHLFSYEEDKNSILVNTLNTYLAENLSANNRKSIRNYYKDGNERHFLQPSILAFQTGEEQFFRELMNTGKINIHNIDYSSEALIEAIRYLHKNNDIGAILIDYIQLLRKAEGKYFNRHEELKQICIDFKDLAVETGLPIILGAQFNRKVENHLQLHPSKIGEAGDIERLASLIVGMWNNNFPPLGSPGELNDIKKNFLNTPGTIYLKILKNRIGRVGIEGLLHFNGNMGKISNDPITPF